jgi:hypothetical protein
MSRARKQAVSGNLQVPLQLAVLRSAWGTADLCHAYDSGEPRAAGEGPYSIEGADYGDYCLAACETRVSWDTAKYLFQCKLYSGGTRSTTG